MATRTGKRFRGHRAQGDYDAIFIGSGMGALCCAALMARAGKKVCLLEQHYTAGGYTHAYERAGFEWDVGVHYLGDVHRPHSLMARLFNHISEGRMTWSPMPDTYDRIFIGEDQYDLVAGTQNFINQLTADFPDEAQAIERYVAKVRKASRQARYFFMGQALPPRAARYYNRLRPHLVDPDLFRTTREVLEGLTSNQRLIAVLTGQWGDYGLPPARSSFMVHATVAKHYMGGGAYPVGGAPAIARSIIPTIEGAGGDVFTYARVEEIIIEAGCATGVRMASGDVLRAPRIISNAGYLATARHLLPAEVAKAHGMTVPEDIRPSSAHLCLYAGFHGSAEANGLSGTNLWLYPDPYHERNVRRFQADPDAPFPLVYLSFPSAKDPDWDRRYPDKCTVQAITLAQPDWFKAWEGTRWGKRGAEYESLKQKFTDRLLEVIYQHAPELRGKLAFCELSTPLSTQWFQQNIQGELYGVDHHPERFESPVLHPVTPVKNLYLTGADVVTAGVGGALMGGLMTAANLMGARLLLSFMPPAPSTSVRQLIKSIQARS
jgi:all-trans-retinol 13,14-reductase